MWFDNLMDDLKHALDVSDTYHGVYFPVVLKLLMGLVLGVVAVVGIIVILATGAIENLDPHRDGVYFVWTMLKSFGVFGLIMYVAYLILGSLIEVGGINMIQSAFRGEKPTQAVFLNGVKSYVSKIVSGKLLMHFICLILSPLLIGLFLIYTVFIGIPTAGYGVLFLTITIGAYFATWTIAIVTDDLGVMEGLGASFSLAKSHFKPMFLLILSATLISQYAVALFGPLGALLAGWFIGGVIRIYFKMVAYKTYKRYRSAGQDYLLDQ